jgi:ribosome biogenesis GTPase A
LDLLDAPGVLPPRLDDQLAALRLALCDDIGQAAYDGEAVAMAFVQMLAGLEGVAASGVKPGLLESRYGVPVPDAHGWLEAAAARHTSGDRARMAQRFLDDFRRGTLGPLALELP